MTLDLDTRWYNAPMLAANAGLLALADPYTSSGTVKIFDVADGSPKTVASKDLGSFIADDVTFSPEGSRLLIVAHGRAVNSWLTSDLLNTSTNGAWVYFIFTS